MYLHTLEEQAKIRKDALTALIDCAGGNAHLARMIGINPKVVGNWVQRGSISKAGAVLVAKHPTLKHHFSYSDLRADADCEGDS